MQEGIKKENKLMMLMTVLIHSILIIKRGLASYLGHTGKKNSL